MEKIRTLPPSKLPGVENNKLENNANIYITKSHLLIGTREIVDMEKNTIHGHLKSETKGIDINNT